jgi:hypothetical protein
MRQQSQNPQSSWYVAQAIVFQPADVRQPIFGRGLGRVMLHILYIQPMTGLFVKSAWNEKTTMMNHVRRIQNVK